MRYIESNLMKGESVLYRSQLHWVEFIQSMVCFILAIMFFGMFKSYVPGGLLIAVAIVKGIDSFINFKTSEFGLTNKRVIVKIGFIRRNSLEVLLNKVEGIKVDQGIWGRILGFGSITISGTGGAKDPFHKIDAPFEFRKKVLEQISAIQDSK